MVGRYSLLLNPPEATLSDRNQELIATYSAIRRSATRVINLLRRYPYEQKFYYEMRNRSPRSIWNVAARLLYLNRTCWNGLYRVNGKGEFNTPFGRYTNPTICDSNRLRKSARLLRRAQLVVGDFDEISSKAVAGDFVYFDPPYITGHQNNGFLKYNAPLFSWEDQERLARLAIQLAHSGVHILVSNADQPSVVRLYKGFNYYRATRPSLIGGKKESRGVITEALLSSYPLLDCPSEVI